MPGEPVEDVNATLDRVVADDQITITQLDQPVLSAPCCRRNADFPTYGHFGLAGDINDIRIHGKDERILVKPFYDGEEYLYRPVKLLSGCSQQEATRLNRQLDMRSPALESDEPLSTG